MSGDPRRVVRGGSWDRYPRYARVADRGRYTPGFRSSYLGLRLVEEVEEIEADPEEADPRRVYRGGSWRLNLRYARVANRGRGTPDDRYSDLGLRLVEVTDG